MIHNPMKNQKQPYSGLAKSIRDPSLKGFSTHIERLLEAKMKSCLDRNKIRLAKSLFEAVIPANATTEYRMAVAGNKDQWVPANGGLETPFRAHSGVRLLYCFNPKQRKHAYLNVDTDIILSDADAEAHMNTYGASNRTRINESEGYQQVQDLVGEIGELEDKAFHLQVQAPGSEKLKALRQKITDKKARLADLKKSVNSKK